MLALMGSICLFLGIIIFKLFFTHTETRTLLQAAILLGIIGGLFDLMFVLRYNLLLGINDLAFVCLSSAVTGTLAMAFSVLPPLILFAKITPAHVEATMFAFYTSLVNASNIYGGKLSGVFFNHFFFQVSDQNLGDLYKLTIMQLVMATLPLFYIKLIPTK